MKKEDVYGHIDHTLLKAYSTWEDIRKIAEDSIRFRTASICIPPSFVKRVHDTYGDSVRICTVIGFPLGYSTTKTKCFEAEQAILEGAEEIDMVINIGRAKEHDYGFVTEEIKALREVCRERILKVIVETCYLTEEEIAAVCRCVTEAGADYIKTSTGFGTRGAELHDLEIFKANIGPDVKIKAAGGMKTKESLFAFLEAGADRLGTSSGISLLNEE